MFSVRSRAAPHGGHTEPFLDPLGGSNGVGGTPSDGFEGSVGSFIQQHQAHLALQQHSQLQHLQQLHHYQQQILQYQQQQVGTTSVNNDSFTTLDFFYRIYNGHVALWCLDRPLVAGCRWMFQCFL